MHRKQMIIALGLVLALAIAAPTIGAGTGSPALKKAGKALRLSNAAKQTAAGAKQKAKQAKQRARAANGVASSAASSAKDAGGKADDALAQLASAKSSTATAAGLVTTANTSEYEDLGGPSVTVTVPQSGLIEVWAQATVGDDGAISVFEDGQQVPDQDPNDICGTPAGALLANTSGVGDLALATGGGGVFGCGGFGPPAPVLLEATPGQHTYSLRYADCDCDPGIDGSFSERSLTVAPRP